MDARLVSPEEPSPDRERMVRALWESEARLHSMVNSAPLVLWALDRNGIFTFSEGRGLEALGLRAGEVVGRSVFDVYADFPQVLQDQRRALAGEEFTSMVTMGELTFETRYSVLRDERGEVREVVGVAVDVTARRRAEAERERMLSLLRATLESTADGVLVVDRAGRIVSFNRKFAEMWGLPDDVLDSGQDERALGAVMERLCDPDGFLRRVQELYATPEAESLDIVELRDGRVFERYSQPQRVGDQVVGRVWSFQDVTERRRAETELRHRERQLASAQQIARLGSWQWELDTGRVVWSDELYRIHGLRPEEYVPTLESYLPHVHPDDRERVRSALLAGAEQGRPFDLEQRILRTDGAIRVMRTRAEVICDRETGRPRLITGACQDVTEQKQAEAALRTSEQRAQLLAERMRAVAVAAAGVLGAASVEELQEILRKASEGVISFDAFFFALYDADAHTLSFLPGYDDGVFVPAATVPASGLPMERVVRERRSLVTLQADDPAGAGAIPMGTNRRSESVIRTPVLSGDRVLAVLSVQSYTPDRYSSEDVEVLETLASLAASALENIRLESERRAAETALRASEASYRAIFDLSNDAIYVHDLETGEIVDANRTACAAHGYTVEEMQRLGVAALTGAEGPYTAEAAAENFRRAARGEPMLVEWMARHRSGRHFWQEVSMQRVMINGTERLLSTARDITERKAAEAALRISEARFRTIFEQFPLSLQIFAPSGETLEVNQAWRDLFHMSPEELGTFNPLTEPQLAELGDLMRRGFAGETLQLPPSLFDTRTAAGVEGAIGPRWIQAFICPVKGEGGVVREVFLIHQDVTSQIEAEAVLRRSHEELEMRVEERTAELAETNMALEEEIAERERAEEGLLQKTKELGAIFRALPDLYFRLEADGTIVDYKAGHSLGLYAPPEAFLGRRVQEVLPPDVGAQLGECVAEVTRTQVPAFVEYSLPLGDESRDFEARLVPLGQDGQIITVVRDITDRKEAERALQRSEEHFRRLIEHSSDMATIVDVHGLNQYQSPSVERILGYRPEELVGTSALSRIHPDDIPLCEEVIGTMMRSPGTTHGVEFRFQHRDGSWRVLEARGRTLLSDSAAAGVVINSRDITERKSTEEALRQSEERFRILAETAPDGIVAVDELGAMVSANPAAERVFGYGPGELVGKPLVLLIPERYREAHRDGLLRYLSTGERRIPWTGVELPGLHRDGHEIPLDISFGEYQKDGQHIFTGYIRDITLRKRAEEALRESEERFRAVVENTSDVITVMDAGGTIRYQSPAIEAIFGYGQEELVGDSAFARVHPDDVERVREVFQRVVSQPGVTERLEFRLRHKNGSWRVIEVAGRSQVGSGGVPLVIVSSRDITVRKEAEEALERARTAAEEANRAKSDFLSRMSHELRTPMNSILGFAQLLARKELPADQRRSVDHILKAGGHLLNLINEILDISRIEANRHHMSLEPVQVCASVHEAMMLIQPLAAQHGIRLEEDVVEAELYALADRQRLVQVLLNLLSNAVKYNRPGGSVHLLCDPSSAAEGGLRIGVRDTGPGIPAHKMDRLFIPFERLGAEQSQVEGTGLGLALSQRLVEAMGGLLSVESVEGEGTTFWVWLARAESPLGGMSRQGGRVAAAASVASEVRASILYIEDNLANLTLVESIFQDRPEITICPALQGQLGLELAAEHRFDLVLLDLHLPDMNGDEVLRRLRSDPRTRSTPVVIISADATPHRSVTLRRAGADAYLTKPFDVDQFLETVDRLLAEGRTEA